MAKFTKLNPEDFKRMTWDAGIILDDFDPASGELTLSSIKWATTGQNSFSATRDLSDMGEDINNCPEGMYQLQKAKPWQAQLTGTAKTVTAEIVAEFLGNADVDSIDMTKIVPRNDITAEDFADKWLVANYSELNGEKNGGFMAIHLMHAMSTGGFTANFDKDASGQFPYTIKAFYDMDDQSTVPFEVYVKAGTAEA